jgi:hypothetical protein
LVETVESKTSGSSNLPLTRVEGEVGMSVNQRKQEQLGMPLGTAAARLRKLVMFRLVQRLGEDICYRCGRKMETVKELSIEHMEPWFNVDTNLFWDLNNVAFSHLSCNAGNRRRGVQRLTGEDGTEWCSGCNRFLDIDNFGRMDKKNYTRPVKYHCNECRKANGWERKK